MKIVFLSRPALVGVVLLLCCVLKPFAQNQKEEFRLSEAASALLAHAGEIRSEAAMKRDWTSSRGHGKETETPLQSLGPISMGMTESQVQGALGKPVRSEEESRGHYRWLYRVDNGSYCVLFESKGKVFGVISDSPRYQVPLGLSVGDLLEEFEKVYGGRRVRIAHALSENQDSMNYPIAHMALGVTRSERPVVRSIMVYTVASH
jgi:hypothetical protein